MRRRERERSVSKSSDNWSCVQQRHILISFFFLFKMNGWMYVEQKLGKDKKNKQGSSGNNWIRTVFLSVFVVVVVVR